MTAWHITGRTQQPGEALGNLGSFGENVFLALLQTPSKGWRATAAEETVPKPALLAGTGVRTCKEPLHTLPAEPQGSGGSQERLSGREAASAKAAKLQAACLAASPSDLDTRVSHKISRASRNVFPLKKKRH